MKNIKGSQHRLAIIGKKENRGVLAHNKSVCFTQMLACTLNCAKNSLYNQPGSAEAGDPTRDRQGLLISWTLISLKPLPPGPRVDTGRACLQLLITQILSKKTLNMPKIRMVTCIFFFFPAAKQTIFLAINSVFIRF